jgi:deazaflavin-dependent oxidoreductase (nitroreductase family)
MHKLKGNNPARAFGIVACILLISGFPLYYPFLRAFVTRLRNPDKLAKKRLSLLDRVDLYLEYKLNKNMRQLGTSLYRLTGGRIAHLAHADVLLLTTRGRRSGKARTILLQGFRDGTNWIIVAANSGRSSQPDWFYNLKNAPGAQLQVMNRTYQVHAEDLSPAEAATFWPHILHVAPAFARYQKNTTRTIPLIRLVPQPAEQATISSKTNDVTPSLPHA